jgi:ABC-type lipoprotein export system ATPase subunit
MADNATVLSIENVHFGYKQAGVMVPILSGASFAVAAGECAALQGASGTGKSTALALAGLLVSPQQGRIVLDGEDTTAWSENTRATWRRDKLGFIFQQHHLLDDFTVRENCALPLLWQGKDAAPVDALLDSMGLSGRANAYPPQLSGGEQQRAAIARALIHRPRLLLADEPTGNLDPENAAIVLKLLLDAARKQGCAVLLVTHDPQIAAAADKRFVMSERSVILR